MAPFSISDCRLVDRDHHPAVHRADHLGGDHLGGDHQPDAGHPGVGRRDGCPAAPRAVCRRRD